MMAIKCAHVCIVNLYGAFGDENNLFRQSAPQLTPIASFSTNILIEVIRGQDDVNQPPDW